jgi:hypothetical protein
MIDEATYVPLKQITDNDKKLDRTEKVFISFDL